MAGEPDTTALEGEVEGKHWRWSVLSSLADYIDGGSIVASGAGLALWAQEYGLTNSTIGLLAALSSNAISCGVGALIGGRLGDLFGRKRIYSLDMLVFMAGTLLVIFSAHEVMLFAGFIVMGLAVGADVPTSWSLIAELSPGQARGKMIALTNIFWYVGPIVTLLLALALSGAGLLGIRLLFVQLFVVAAVTWWLRRGIIESPRYAAATEQGGEGTTPAAESRLADLARPRNRRALLFVFGVFCLWNIPAGTYGFFLPFIVKNAGGASQAASVAVQGLWFVTSIVALVVVFMRYNDRVNRAVLYGVTALIQAVGFWLFVFVSPNLIGWVIANVVLFGLGQGAGQWPLNRLWSVELFPTMIRNTAQGVIFGGMRLVLGVWSYFVPALLGCTSAAGSLTRCSTSGFHTMFLILSVMLTVTGVAGFIWGPRTEGMTLEQIERARKRGEMAI
jgi:MFS transporter, SP family, inositol transporter